MTIFRLAVPLLCLTALSACLAPEPDPPEVASCKAALAAQGNPSSTVISSGPVIDGKMVTLRDTTGTNWNCVVDSFGAIESVEIAI